MVIANKCPWWKKWFGQYPDPDDEVIVDVPQDVRQAYHRLMNETSKLHSRVNEIQRHQSHDALASLVKSITKVGELDKR